MVIGLWINQDIAINKWKVSDITITSLKKLENIFRRQNMTIREQLEKEMEQEEIKEMEEENADSEKLDKVDNSNSNNDSSTNRDY